MAQRWQHLWRWSSDEEALEILSLYILDSDRNFGSVAPAVGPSLSDYAFGIVWLSIWISICVLRLGFAWCYLLYGERCSWSWRVGYLCFSIWTDHWCCSRGLLCWLCHFGWCWCIHKDHTQVISRQTRRARRRCPSRMHLPWRNSFCVHKHRDSWLLLSSCFLPGHLPKLCWRPAGSNQGCWFRYWLCQFWTNREIGPICASLLRSLFFLLSWCTVRIGHGCRERCCSNSICIVLGIAWLDHFE